MNKDLVKSIFDDIVSDINRGILKTGDKINISELQTRFGVSKNVVREALQGLRLSNIVNIVPGKGVYVTDISIKDLLNPMDLLFDINEKELYDLWDVRKMIELWAVNSASIRITEKQLDILEENINDMAMYMSKKDDLFIEEDLLFHKNIISFSGNNALLHIYGFVQKSLLKVMKLVNQRRLIKDYEIVIKHHWEILKLIKAKKNDEAEKALKNHLEHSEEDVVGFFKNNIPAKEKD